MNILGHIDATLELLEKKKKLPKNFEVLKDECYELIINTRDEKSISAFKEILKGLFDGDMDAEKAFSIMKEKLGTELSADLNTPLLSWSKDVYKYGLQEVANQIDVKFSYNLVDQNAVEIMNKHNIFFIGQYYDHHNGDIMKNNLGQLFAEALRTDQVAESVAKLMETDKKLSINYFKGLVEHATSRIRNVGNISGYEKAEIEYAEVFAILDDTTSEICLEMNGRKIPVKKMTKLKDEFLSIDTEIQTISEVTDQLKELLPFWRDKDTESIKGKDTVEILDLHPGLALPPYHWRCRTTTIAYFEETETS